MIVAQSAKPPIAVLIGLVSTEDRDRVLETLTSLHERQGDVACEVILADRRHDAVSAEIRRRFPQVPIVECGPGTTLPEMRTLALDRSQADIVAVTEDHCVPCDGWLGQVLDAFKLAGDDIVGVGGVVENGVKDTSFDWATYLCEYSAFSAPVIEGIAPDVPGMNVAYKRSVLLSVAREKLTSGFWETTLHPMFRAEGKSFISRNAIKMFHCKKFSRPLFFSQRFVYSRYYAGLRFGAGRWPVRIAAAVASLALPPLLFHRMVKATAAKNLGAEFKRASPTLALLVVVWSLGEIAGYILGPGDALAQIE